MCAIWCQLNRNDPVSGFAGIPRNMSTLGTKLRDVGYKTVFSGKWDIGEILRGVASTASNKAVLT